MRHATIIRGVLLCSVWSAGLLYAESPVQPPAPSLKPPVPSAARPDVMAQSLEGTIETLNLQGSPSFLTVRQSGGTFLKVEVDRASTSRVRVQDHRLPQAFMWEELRKGQRIRIQGLMREDMFIARRIELLD